MSDTNVQGRFRSAWSQYHRALDEIQLRPLTNDYLVIKVGPRAYQHLKYETAMVQPGDKVEGIPLIVDYQAEPYSIKFLLNVEVIG